MAETSPHGDNRLQLPQLDGVLSRVFGVPLPVNPMFRIIEDSDFGAGATEFYSDTISGHVVLLDGGPQTEIHSKLSHSEQGCVLPDVRVGERVILVVPEGAKVLSHVTPLITKNFEDYSVMFEQLGVNLAKIEAVGAGLPNGSRLLHRFVFAINSKEARGGSVYYVPPYNLDPAQTTENLLDQLGEELVTDMSLSTENALALIEKARYGWNARTRS